MHLDCFMIVLIFILFNEYNSLSVDQYIFQNQNNFNSKKTKIIYLENVIFIHFNICLLAFFGRLALFLQAFVIKSFQYCRGDRFLSLTFWVFFCYMKL